MAPSSNAQSVLNSWKEIANYTGRGIRTLQRWEHELAFPVHRISHNERGSVFAYRVEIDTWFRRSSAETRSNLKDFSVPSPLDTEPATCTGEKIRGSTGPLDAETEQLHALVEKLQKLLSEHEQAARTGDSRAER
jgi:hypothetical protein